MNKLFNSIKNWKWFKEETPLPKADLSVLHTDVHSHLIPSLDDGSKKIEESIAVIRGLSTLGYKKLITTPHIMADVYKNTSETIHRGLDELRQALSKENIPIEIEAAAEYYLDFEFQDRISKKDLLTFGDKYVLFELSFLNEPPMLAEMIFKMQTAGYKPVLAHPERYSYWHNDFDKYINLKERGVIMQLNIGSIAGYYSLEAKAIAERMIDENLIDLLGTDCHNMSYIELIENTLQHKFLHQLLANPMLINSKL